MSLFDFVGLFVLFLFIVSAVVFDISGLAFIILKCLHKEIRLVKLVFSIASLVLLISFILLFIFW